MDPLSITTGVITLVETGTRLSKTLYDLYTAYRTTDPVLQDLASEVDLITSLFDNLNNSLNRRPQSYSESFQRSTKSLITKCNIIFREIDGMLPSRNEKGDLKKHEKLVWAAFTKDKVDRKKEDLRRVAHMFLFVETVNRCVERPERQSGSLSLGSVSEAKYGGVLQQTSVEVNGVGSPRKGSAPFEATLTLRPTAVTESRMAQPMLSPERTRESRREGFTRLQNMRMSPFFDKELLDDQAERIKPIEIDPRSNRTSTYTDAVPYNEVVEIDLGSDKPPASPPIGSEENGDRTRAEPVTRAEAAKDVSELLSRWSKKSSLESTRFSFDSAATLVPSNGDQDVGEFMSPKSTPRAQSPFPVRSPPPVQSPTQRLSRRLSQDTGYVTPWKSPNPVQITDYGFPIKSPQMQKVSDGKPENLPSVREDSSEISELPPPVQEISNGIHKKPLPIQEVQEVGYGVPEKPPPTVQSPTEPARPVNGDAKETESVSPKSNRFKSVPSTPRAQKSYAHFCNGCRQGIESVRHHCTECGDFNYCGNCYMYPPTRHKHSLGQFKQIR